jgi:hypothetical protein
LEINASGKISKKFQAVKLAEFITCQKKKF